MVFVAARARSSSNAAHVASPTQARIAMAATSTLFVFVVVATAFQSDKSAPVDIGGHSAYLFGYGSLMHPLSRGHTRVDTGDAFPVRVNGLRRGWNCETNATTVVAVEFASTYFTNGVLVEVTQDSLLAFDKRELYYTRELVPHSDIQVLTSTSATLSASQINRDLPVWVYTLKPERSSWRATPQKPISQTYLDACLGGAMRISDQLPKDIDFMGNFLNSTLFWAKPHNDRSKPLRSSYMAEHVTDFERVRIDQVLSDHSYLWSS